MKLAEGRGGEGSKKVNFIESVRERRESCYHTSDPSIWKGERRLELASPGHKKRGGGADRIPNDFPYK